MKDKEEPALQRNPRERNFRDTVLRAAETVVCGKGRRRAKVLM